MTDDQALDSTCTSSLVKNDKSNYWTPKLYFHAENGSFIDVPMFYMNVYYFFEPTTDKITAFQPGHRMVIGSPSLRTPPATGGLSILDLSQGTPQPVQWTCPRSSTAQPLYPPDSDGLHGVGIQDPGNQGAGVGFPDQNCDGYASPLRADIHFPSCYDKSQGLDAYKTNMKFPTNGNCPTGWEHKPHLFYEVYWNTPLFADLWTPGQGKQPFVLSNGDPTGYSLHADFISGWDVTTLQQIIDNCNAGDSGMDKCPGLIGGLNDPSTSCNIPSAINEQIYGVLDQLPGNNPLGQWGVPPSGGTSPPASSSASSTAVNVVSTPSTPATKPATKPATEPATLPATVAPTTKVAVVSESSAGSPTTLAPPTGTTHTDPGAGNVVTSYVTRTSWIVTTVTIDVPGSSPTSTSSIPAGWSYKGCFSDNVNARVLTGITFADIGNHQVTNTKCTTYCGAKGFSLAGTEYGGQCFCGNELVGSSSIAESMCNMACEGDGSQTCGGPNALSVYTTGSAKKRHLRIRGSSQ
ncbi:hypothetical protein OIDMADRAFT_117145 [Oidiodendron maius Zn]|uniref:WSC domain-containing protein n=1 Tax=Oidiodendron maius (strain Zn) TaxID=913774 RepID=A0A0C3H6H1_OIDMZ|nr:hypothetical protein OIDMADRAFT_117145 [Oidiodendron maius Zn]